MTRCDFRTHGECACPAGQCQQQIKPITAPVPRATTLDQITTIAFITVVALICALVANELKAGEREYQISRRV